MGTTTEPVSREEVRRLLGEHYRPEESGRLRGEITSLRRQRNASHGFVVVLIILVAGLAMRQPLIPYPIVYHPDGHIIWHGQAATTREERFIDVGLIDWIVSARRVSDSEVQFREDREMALAQVYGKAATLFKSYNKATIDAYKDKQRRVFVRIARAQIEVTREGPDRVSITWVEEWTPEYGYGSETHRYQARLTYAWYAQPKGFTVAQAQLNPRRLYVTDYMWDEIRQEAR